MDWRYPFWVKKSRALALPPSCIFLVWTSVHLSMVSERTKLMWTPRPLCCPLQFKQMKVLHMM